MGKKKQKKAKKAELATTTKTPTRRPERMPRRIWEASKNSILAAGWPTFGVPIDVDIRRGLRALRTRARQQAQNNDHVQHFIRMTRTNVVGHQGIRLQARAEGPNGQQDKKTNKAIEDAWSDWSELGSCEVSGTMSFLQVQGQFVNTVARDGEAFFRKIFGWPDNPHRFALQLIDPETIDVELNRQLSDGRRIVMGIEIDEFRRRRAFYLIPEEDVSAPNGGSYAARRHVRVPAEEIYHCFLPEWIWQTRGVPWVATALMRLNMLGGYEDAEITAARVAAAKMGFYKPTDDAGQFTGDGENENGTDDEGSFIQNAAAGEFEVMPFGYEFQSWDPQHPNANYGDFVKSVLRSIASGLGVNYNSLANDLEGVNYTSLRHGALIEREIWKCLQQWMIDSFLTPVFRDWLDQAMLVNAIKVDGIPLDPLRFGEFKRCTWQPLRWAAVDPLKERQGQRGAFDMRTETLSQIIRDGGRDPDEVWSEMAEDFKKLEAMGIPMPTAAATAPGAPGAEPDAPGDDEPEDEPEDEDDEQPEETEDDADSN